MAKIEPAAYVDVFRDELQRSIEMSAKAKTRGKASGHM